jgi:hypothetical protein
MTQEAHALSISSLQTTNERNGRMGDSKSRSGTLSFIPVKKERGRRRRGKEREREGEGEREKEGEEYRIRRR